MFKQYDSCESTTGHCSPFLSLGRLSPLVHTLYTNSTDSGKTMWLTQPNSYSHGGKYRSQGPSNRLQITPSNWTLHCCLYIAVGQAGVTNGGHTLCLVTHRNQEICLCSKHFCGVGGARNGIFLVFCPCKNGPEPKKSKTLKKSHSLVFLCSPAQWKRFFILIKGSHS